MKLKFAVTGFVVSAALTIPFTASADPGWKENGRGYYSEERGDRESHGKNKHKEKHRYRNEHVAGGPPPWAPAHGWRRKHESGAYRYDDDHRYERRDYAERDGAHLRVSKEGAFVDVGIKQGTCNRKTIGTVIGGVVGGVIGHKVSEKENRNVGTLLGAVIGGVVGNKIGRSMDKADQHCTGQVLEQARDKQTVRWSDKDSSGQYKVTPLRTYQADGKYCRDFVTEYMGPNGTEKEKSSACRSSDGTWKKQVM